MEQQRTTADAQHSSQQHIVVGYVRSRDCDHALDRAFALSHELPASIVHVVRAIPSEEGVEVDILDDAFERARKETIEAVTRACERNGQPPTPVHLDVSFGDPAASIVSTAQRVAASLVIIGHGHDGAIARELATRLRCALLVATADRYSSPDAIVGVEVARPDDPNRKPHVYRYDHVNEQTTHRIGPTRLY